VTDIEVGPAHDAERFVATDHLVWFAEVPRADAETLLVGMPEDQRFAAEVPGADPSTYAGVYGVFPMTLPVPGPEGGTRHEACAGLTWVGVHPDHRRQGVLTAMMRDHLERVRADGIALGALHASEPSIYGRHGYGLASLELEVRLGRGTTLTAPHLDDDAAAIRTHLATVSDADVPARMRACHLATAGLGSIIGEEGYYRRVCQMLPEELRDKEPWRILFARRDGEDVGFAMFRRTHKWENARPSGELVAWTVQGDPAARLALLRRLVDFDLMGSVKIKAGSEDPVLYWAGGPRGTADLATYDSLWVRLVDVPAALQARTWTMPCDVVVRVVDTSAPWNDGCWRIHASDGVASVESSDAEPDLALAVDVLGAAYLGGSSILAHHRAGLVAEHTPGSVVALSQAMRTPAGTEAAVGF
jgi:GNAT superfamily N-acetyltransferase